MRRNFLRFVLGLLAIVWAFSPTDAHAQFRYPLPYPYGGYRYGPESDLRIDVTPKEASVYVDGYFAGTVDEFNGTFQRLHVMPGEHEIVIYLDGYRSIRERLYLSPNATRKIVGTKDRLAPGEPSEPAPQPIEPPAQTAGSPVARPVPRRGLPPPPDGAPPAPPAPRRRRTRRVRRARPRRTPRKLPLRPTTRLHARRGAVRSPARRSSCPHPSPP